MKGGVGGGRMGKGKRGEGGEGERGVRAEGGWQKNESLNEGMSFLPNGKYFFSKSCFSSFFKNLLIFFKITLCLIMDNIH